MANQHHYDLLREAEEEYAREEGQDSKYAPIEYLFLCVAESVVKELQKENEKPE